MYTPPQDPADEGEHVAAYLAAPIEAVWHSFDVGRTASVEFFTEDKTPDAHPWAHIARYEAAGHLAALKSDEWTLRTHHHSGIELLADPFRVKVCKAVAASPQAPGRNRARREFYQQLDAFGGANLILHWTVEDDELRLGLCKPRGKWEYKGRPNLDWNVAVNYDPFAGLTFKATDENVILDDGLFGQEEATGE